MRISPQTSKRLRDVAKLVKEQHVGCVVVVKEGRPTGIVTNRDLVIRVLAPSVPPDVPIGEIMTPSPATVRRTDFIDPVVATMREAGVRRVPIVDSAGVLVGLVSLDDVSVLLAGELRSAVEAIRGDRGPCACIPCAPPAKRTPHRAVVAWRCPRR